MRQAVVHSGQSVFDIAIQHCGSVDAAYDVAVLNSLPLDAELLPGQTLLIPEVTDKRVVDECRRKGVVPGTGWVAPLYTPTSYYLGSVGEMLLVYSNLVVNGLGGFVTNDWNYGYEDCYHTSSEFGVWNHQYIFMRDGFIASNQSKYMIARVRPIRHFELNSSKKEFNIKDEMPSGGHIFNKIDLGGGNFRYYETAPNDISKQVWCNIETNLVGTSDEIGTGLENSKAIVAQAGHTTSAAQDCLNFQLST